MKNKHNLIALALIVMSSALIIFILIPDWRENKDKERPMPDFLPVEGENFSPIIPDVSFNADLKSGREEFLKQNIGVISPEKEVLGGKFYVTNLSWIDDNRVIVEYEDGHIALSAEAVFENKLEPSSFTILKSSEGEMPTRVFSPEAGALISSPLTVKGEAPGSWFFEATLRLRLLDDKGNIIANSWGQAGSDWMTENYVPYEGVLEFKTEAETGELVILNDNPSGLPENEVFVKIPVRFK